MALFPWNPHSILVSWKKIFSAKSKHPQTNPAGSTQNCGQLRAEPVLLDKQKRLPFLSHRSLRTDRHPPGRGFHAPPPHYSDNICHNSICAQSRFGTCWLVDIWPFFSPFLIPLMSARPIWLHFWAILCILTQSLTFPLFSLFSDWGNGEGKKYLRACSISLSHTHAHNTALMTSHYLKTDAHFFFLSSAFSCWMVAVDPADILNHWGMLREAQVPGNLTPTALPSAWTSFYVH